MQRERKEMQRKEKKDKEREKEEIRRTSGLELMLPLSVPSPSKANKIVTQFYEAWDTDSPDILKGVKGNSARVTELPFFPKWTNRPPSHKKILPACILITFNLK